MSIKGIIKKELLENKWIFIIGMVILVVFGLTNSLSYEMMTKLFADPSTEIPQNIPGITPEYLEMIKDYGAYTWSSWFDKSFIQTLTVLAIILGMGIIAGEVSKDTIGFLLTKPFSRIQVFAAKYVAGAAVLLAMVIVSSALQYAVALIPGPELNMDFGRFMLGSISGFPGLLMIFSLAALFSTLLSDRLKAGLGAGVIALGLSIPGFFRDYADYNVYKYFVGNAILKGEGFPWLSFLLLFVAALGLFLVGLKVFKKREF